MVIVVCSKTDIAAWVPGQLKVSLHRYEFAVDKQ